MSKTAFQRKRIASFFNPKLADNDIKAGLAAAVASPDEFRKWAASLTDPIVIGLDDMSTVRGIFSVQSFSVGQEISFPVFNKDELVSQIWTVPQLYSQPTQLPIADIAYPTTYELGTSMEWPKRMQQDGRIDVVNMCLRLISEAIAAAEEASGWALLKTASTAANTAVQLDDGAAGHDSFSPQLLKLMLARMMEHPTNPRQQMGRQLTDIYGAPTRLLDTIDWTSMYGNAEKSAVIRSGAIDRVMGVQLTPYWGLTQYELYGFDLSAKEEAFNMALQGAFESEELVGAADNWRVGVRVREIIGFLVKDARYLLKGIVGT